MRCSNLGPPPETHGAEPAAAAGSGRSGAQSHGWRCVTCHPLKNDLATEGSPCREGEETGDRLVRHTHPSIRCSSRWVWSWTTRAGRGLGRRGGGIDGMICHGKA